MVQVDFRDLSEMPSRELFLTAVSLRNKNASSHDLGAVYEVLRVRQESKIGYQITKDSFRKTMKRLINRYNKSTQAERDDMLETMDELDKDIQVTPFDQQHPPQELSWSPVEPDGFISSNKEDAQNRPVVEIQYKDTPYYYNEHTDHYIFHLKSFPKPVEVSGKDLALIKERYSNWDDMQSSVNEISREFVIPRRVLIEIIKKMGWTHDSDPFMDTELATKSEDELIEETLLKKRRNIKQQLDRRSWDEMKKDAMRYRQLEHTVVKPLMEAMNNRQGEYKKVNVTINISAKGKQKLSVVLPIMDIHMGKLPFYVRGEYSFDQFQNECISALEGILHKVYAYCSPSEIVTIVGSDWFHVDNIKHATSELTSQAGQMVGSYWDVVVRGYDLSFMMFDILSSIGCPMFGYEVDGNHDRMLSLNLSLALQQRYRGVKNVNIDASPDNRKYHVHGRNLYSFLHGDFLKQQAGTRQKSILTNIHNDTRRLRINTLDIDNIVVFSGHVHKKSLNFDEEAGILDVVVPSLSTTDMWHHNNSYEGNRRSVSAFLYSQDSKDMDILTYNL